MGGYNPATAIWSGTLGADGTTLTPIPKLPATAPTPTASSVPFYPLGFWNANQKGGAVIPIPTAGYFNIAKNNASGNAGMSNTVGNAAANASASWTWASGGFSADWNGLETATVGKVAKNGAALPANTRAVADVSDPIYLFVASDDEPLTFEVALSDLEIDIAADQPADAYYDWSVLFGAGQIAGENVLYSDSGGQDFSSPGTYTPDPGTVVDYSNSSLSEGVYWLTADLNVGAEVTTPEPATSDMIGVCLLLLSAVLGRGRFRRRSRESLIDFGRQRRDPVGDSMAARPAQNPVQRP